MGVLGWLACSPLLGGGSRPSAEADPGTGRPLDRHEANLFFRLISARYEKGSIILTSNKHVRDWPEIFTGDEVLGTAILDRLLHHVHVVNIDGRSYRLRELQGILQGTTSSATPRSQSPEESRIPEEVAA